MTPPLFLLNDIAGLAPGQQVRLGGAEGHHAARVRRVRIGEPVLVADGAGTLLRCEVQAVAGDAITLAVLAADVVAVRRPRLVVVQALAKGERAELAVELLTELGVDRIVPWPAARSVVRWDGARGEKSLARWRSTAREAAKQSRRVRVPDVATPLGTERVAALLTNAAAALVLHEDAPHALAGVALPADGEVGDVVLVVGPEGGVDPSELAAFERAGACAVRLGEQVLRTSTAGAAALAVLSVRLGRWT